MQANNVVFLARGRRLGTWRSARVCTMALCVLACLCVLAALAVLPVPQAFANREITAPIDVSDDITRIHVSKMDADTHEYVTGAQLQILEASSGTVVDEWTSDGTVHENEKQLDVNVDYILREVSAPEGYDKVDDVRFQVNEIEGQGVNLLEYDHSRVELTESYHVTLYDKRQPTEEEVVVTKDRQTQQATTTSSGGSSGKGSTAKTGDTLPAYAVAALAALVAAAALAAAFARRRAHQRR